MPEQRELYINLLYNQGQLSTSTSSLQAESACLQCTEKGQRLKQDLRAALGSVKTCGLFGMQVMSTHSIFGKSVLDANQQIL